MFDIVKGNRLTKQEMIKGETPYIGATAFNNGVTNTIGNRENLHPAGVLTVAYDGSIGQTFFQIKEFWASDAVNILYPKFTLFPEVAYYLATLIRIAGKKYGYNDKWKLKVMKDTEIPLPTTPDGKPDWKYMTDYVAALKRNVDNNLAPLDLFQL